MRDITLGDTFYHQFTTRAFASGVPTSLLGTPVLSVLEENNAVPITAGISVNVDRASVTGLNEATIVATGGNGFENGKSYCIYVSTGTVDGVSVIGEVVGQFTVGASAAAVDLANGTDGLGALKAILDGLNNISVADILAGTITELSSVPGASPTFAQAVAFQYMALKNKRDTTAATDEIHKDNGTVLATASVSDDTVTFQKGKYA